jgi:hypothetical protein
MADKIKLVQGDTKPNLIVNLTDQTTGLPIGIVGATPRLKLRASGSSTISATLIGTPIAGFLQEDGTVNSNAPYNVAGAGGRCVFAWTTDSLAVAGDFDGEVEITFSDGSIQTVYDLLKFKIRDQF